MKSMLVFQLFICLTKASAISCIVNLFKEMYIFIHCLIQSRTNYAQTCFFLPRSWNLSVPLNLLYPNPGKSGKKIFFTFFPRVTQLR